VRAGSTARRCRFENGHLIGSECPAQVRRSVWDREGSPQYSGKGEGYMFQSAVHGRLIYTVIHMSDRLLIQENPNPRLTPPTRSA